MSSDRPLDINLIHKLRTTRHIGRTFINVLDTDSTMEEAVRIITSTSSASHGTVICAEHQSAGQGRVAGRTWDSAAGEDILCTVLLHSDFVDPVPLRIVWATPVAIVQALRKLALNAVIKWPNDVHVAGRKISGMMVNTVGNFYVLGFGVNINANNSQTEDRTSVIDCVGIPFAREAILADILNKLEELLIAEATVPLNLFREYDCLTGNAITIFPKGRENQQECQQGTVLRIDDNGMLVVSINGEESTLSAQDVSTRLDQLPEKFRDPRFPRPHPARLIDGVWRNQLGSFVTFVASDDGSLNGYYQTAVGNVPQGTRHPLRGSYQSLTSGDVLLGWTVSWDQTGGAVRSLTSWVARLYLNETVQPGHYETNPTIESTWLLISDRPAWESVRTNKDIFKKQ